MRGTLRKSLAVACIVTFVPVMSGCQAMLGGLSDYLAEYKDTAEYEKARQIASELCNSPERLDRLELFLGQEAADRIRLRCEEKRKERVPTN